MHICNNTAVWCCQRCVSYVHLSQTLPKGPQVQGVQHLKTSVLDCVWNVMAHAQIPDFVFRRNGRVHLNRRGRQFSRLLAAEVCASAVVMLDTSCSEVVWIVLVTQSIRQFPLHFPSRASPCAITFHLDSTTQNDFYWSASEIIVFVGQFVGQFALNCCNNSKCIVPTRHTISRKTTFLHSVDISE